MSSSPWSNLYIHKWIWFFPFVIDCSPIFRHNAGDGRAQFLFCRLRGFWRQSNDWWMTLKEVFANNTDMVRKQALVERRALLLQKNTRMSRLKEIKGIWTGVWRIILEERGMAGKDKSWPRSSGRGTYEDSNRSWY